MFCKKCGKKLEENTRFCPGCGTKTEEEEKNVVIKEPLQKNDDEDNEPGPWRKFAIAGRTFGVLSVAIPYIGIIFTTFGIIFGALGIPSKVARGRAITGIVLSVASIIQFLIIYYLIIIGILEYNLN